MLFRRRSIWWPTLPGAVLLLVLAALVVVVLARSAATLLVLQAPVPNARTLVIEGWLEAHELRQAADAARGGHYERVLTTGGPLDDWRSDQRWRDGAVRAADYLRANGLTSVPVIAVATPRTARDRTYGAAVAVRDWAHGAGVELGPINVFSAGVHTRRSRLLYRLAFGDAVEVGALAARPADYEPQRWWRTSYGVKATMGETLSLLWTTCCFWPPAPPSASR